MITRHHGATLVAALLWTSSASADPARVLPFWSRPFPEGFTGRHFADRAEALDPRPRCAIRDGDGRTVVLRRRCRAALRALD